jgi:hypothetical protein
VLSALSKAVRKTGINSALRKISAQTKALTTLVLKLQRQVNLMLSALSKARRNTGKTTALSTLNPK